MRIGVVVSTAILEDSRMLMVKEGKEESLGRWNIPSGRSEEGETIVEAAKREVAEETWL